MYSQGSLAVRFSGAVTFHVPSWTWQAIFLPCVRANIISDLNNNFADGSASHAIFFGNDSLTIVLSVNDRQIAFCLHRSSPIVGILKCLK